MRLNSERFPYHLLNLPDNSSITSDLSNCLYSIHELNQR